MIPLPQPISHGRVTFEWRRRGNLILAKADIDGYLILKEERSSPMVLKAAAADQIYDLARSLDHVHTAIRGWPL